jgi:hypothetical protein
MFLITYLEVRYSLPAQGRAPGTSIGNVLKLQFPVKLKTTLCVTEAGCHHMLTVRLEVGVPLKTGKHGLPAGGPLSCHWQCTRTY